MTKEPFFLISVNQLHSTPLPYFANLPHNSVHVYIQQPRRHPTPSHCSLWNNYSHSKPHGHVRLFVRGNLLCQAKMASVCYMAFVRSDICLFQVHERKKKHIFFPFTFSKNFVAIKIRSEQQISILKRNCFSPILFLVAFTTWSIRISADIFPTNDSERVHRFLGQSCGVPFSLL